MKFPPPKFFWSCYRKQTYIFFGLITFIFNIKQCLTHSLLRYFAGIGFSGTHVTNLAPGLRKKKEVYASRNPTYLKKIPTSTFFFWFSRKKIRRAYLAEILEKNAPILKMFINWRVFLAFRKGKNNVKVLKKKLMPINHNFFWQITRNINPFLWP